VDASRERRDSWYVALAAGGGDAHLTFGDPPSGYEDTLSMREVFGKSPTRLSFDLQLGATVSPHVLLGADLSLFMAAARRETPMGDAHRSLNIGTLTAMATVFPWRTGPFLRGGLGVASYWTRATFPNAPTVSADSSGLALTAGVGYAAWLGRSFNLIVSLDASGQSYNDPSPDVPDTSSFWALRLGAGWY
jgi:hypothetical protein